MLYKDKSKIHGYGLFTDQPIKQGSLIGVFKVVPARYSTKYSIYGFNKWNRAVCILKYSNHSKNPNAWVDDELNMWALKQINAFSEIVWDYGENWND